MRHALIQNGRVRRVVIGSPHPASLPVEFPALAVTPDTHRITLNPVDQWEVHPTKVVATYTIEERDLEAEAAERERELMERRRGMSVSRFQARVMIRRAGLLEQVEAMVAHPDTNPFVADAWLEAREFKRLSPTLLQLAGALGLTDEQLDAMFEQAQQIEA